MNPIRLHTLRALLVLAAALGTVPMARGYDLDHDDFRSTRSEVINVIDSFRLERDAGGNPGPTSPQPALAGFHTALDTTRQHSRTALAHLRAGEVPLAVMEISRLRESFSLLMERYGAERRAAHKDKTEYATTVVDIPLRIVTAQMMLDFGRPDIAANSLVAVCRSLGALRDPPDEAAAATCDEE